MLLIFLMASLTIICFVYAKGMHKATKKNYFINTFLGKKQKRESCKRYKPKAQQLITIMKNLYIIITAISIHKVLKWLVCLLILIMIV